MTFERGNLGYFLTFMFIGAILGSALGTLIAKFVPSLSIIKSNLTGALGFSLEIVSFSLNLNIASIIGLITGIIIFKKL